MWIGTLLLDQELGGFKDVAQLQRAFLDEHADVWEGRKCHFYADIPAASYPNGIDSKPALPYDTPFHTFIL